MDAREKKALALLARVESLTQDPGETRDGYPGAIVKYVDEEGDDYPAIIVKSRKRGFASLMVMRGKFGAQFEPIVRYSDNEEPDTWCYYEWECGSTIQESSSSDDDAILKRNGIKP